MRILTSLLLTFCAVIVFGATRVSAQETIPEKVPARPFKLMQELGLSREQVQQLGAINKERRPIVQAAQQRWRLANRVLDTAVYADNVSEDDLKELVRLAQIAQSELLKEKTITEFKIRQVLTPEQLVKFRALRERIRENAMDRAVDRSDKRPSDRLPAAERLRNRRNAIKPQ